MPTVCTFSGAKIQLFWDEHPPPHFHVMQGEYDCSLRIDTLAILEGDLPSRLLSVVRSWAGAHRVELIEGWNRCRELQPPSKIAPPD